MRLALVAIVAAAGLALAQDRLDGQPAGGSFKPGRGLNDDYQYNTCGSWDYPNENMKNYLDYGTYGIALIQVPTILPNPVIIQSVEFCVAGPLELEAVIWTGLTSLTPPGAPGTETYSIPYAPVVASGGESMTGVEYTSVDVSSLNIVVNPGDFIAFGTSLTPGTYIGIINSVPAGAATYAFWQGAWDADAPWGWTTCLQIQMVEDIGLVPSTWAGIKAVF
jgi:hypothetical protein